MLLKIVLKKMNTIDNECYGIMETNKYEWLCLYLYESQHKLCKNKNTCLQ